MMYSNYFQFHNTNVVKYDLVSKFNYKNTHQIPVFKKIILSFTLKELNFKRLLQSTAALELIGNQAAILLHSKKANISLKIRKGNPVGCKIILRKKNLSTFLTKLILFILPDIKAFEPIKFKEKKRKLNSLSFLLEDLLSFPELEKQFELFQKLPQLNISIVLSSGDTKEFPIFLTSFRFPIN